MSDQPSVNFGSVNLDLLARWRALAPDQDSPVWMVNLMRYKPVADYGDGTSSQISGRAADDLYSPVAVLADLGAVVAFFGDVVDQRAGEPVWERVGVVRYPSRASFLDMQRRDDFREKYVHKEAGMASTIILACQPTFHEPAAQAADRQMVLRVRRLEPDTTAPDEPAGVVPVVTFEVEGVIVGDGRDYDDVRFDYADERTLAEITSLAGIAEQFVAVLDRGIDNLVGSIASLPKWQ